MSSFWIYFHNSFNHLLNPKGASAKVRAIDFMQGLYMGQIDIGPWHKNVLDITVDSY